MGFEPWPPPAVPKKQPKKVLKGRDWKYQNCSGADSVQTLRAVSLLPGVSLYFLKRGVASSILIDRRFPCWHEDISTRFIFCSKAHQSSPFSERPAFFQPRLSSMRLFRSEGWFHARVSPFMDAPCGAFHSVAQIIPSFCLATFYSHSRIYPLTCVLVVCTEGGKKRPPRVQENSTLKLEASRLRMGENTQKHSASIRRNRLRKNGHLHCILKKNHVPPKDRQADAHWRFWNIERRWKCDSVKFRRI